MISITFLEEKGNIFLVCLTEKIITLRLGELNYVFGDCSLYRSLEKWQIDFEPRLPRFIKTRFDV